MDVYRELEERGLIYDATPGLKDELATKKISVYVGIDPTASSLHIGHLLPVIVLSRLQKFGHKPIVVVGGGTGMIGDPSGKNEERPLLTKERIRYNLNNIKTQLKPYLDFSVKGNSAIILDNARWLAKVKLLDFLRSTGKHFTVNYMLSKESVKRRIDLEDGITFTEFSYMLAQSYDYFILFEEHSCKLQIGGSDQWGNITAGIDLIRKKRNERVYGLVLPLLTTAEGVKFGKTSTGTVWLSPELTSPYNFYQTWINVDDADVIKYLKFFTFLSLEEINILKELQNKNPEKREAQRILAKEMTSMVHGKTSVAKIEKASKILFGGKIKGIKIKEIMEVFSGVPTLDISRERLFNEYIQIIDLCVYTSLTSSKSEARRLIKNQGLYLNNTKVSDELQKIGNADLLENLILVLRKGVKDYRLVKVVD